MKFPTHCLGLFNFLTHTILRTSKSIGNNTMKKMLLATGRWPCLLQDVLNRRLLFKTNRQQQHQRKPSPIISSVSGNRAEENLSMQPKFVAAQKMLLKQKPSKHSGKWIARFYYFRHLYSAGSACVLLINIRHELPIDISNHLGNSLINILLGSFQLLRSDQPL